MTAPIVDVIAEALYRAECKACGARAAWSRLPSLRIDALKEKVEDVLLAALNAGYVLTRAPELDEDARKHAANAPTEPPPAR